EDDWHNLSHCGESTPRSDRLKAVLGPALDGLDMNVEQADVGFGGNKQRGGGALFRPFLAAVIEVVVDPGERARARVLLECLQLPVGRAEPGAAVEGQVRKRGQAEDSRQVVVGAILP